MLREGKADGFIGGATRTTADTLRAVFSIVGLAPKVSTLFGFFFIEAHDGRLIILADCAVIPEPSPKQLANIAIGAAEAYVYFTEGKPKVAFLSFSTHGSAEHPMVDNVRQAARIAREKAPSLMIEGEWQADAALDLFTAQIKGVGNSPMAGQANVLIAPDLNCGNIAYKLIQRLGGLRAVGPVLWGTALPANDLSRGCSADDILDMMTLTTLQAQKSKIVEKPAHAC
jgi:phosphate acetyltransferase